MSNISSSELSRAINEALGGNSYRSMSRQIGHGLGRALGAQLSPQQEAMAAHTVMALTVAPLLIDRRAAPLAALGGLVLFGCWLAGRE